MADRIVVMNSGTIEQVGTPRAVYLQPASPFVAEFIGKTNTFPAVVRGEAEIDIGGRLFRCPPDGHAAGAHVWVFLRPEDIVVRGARADASNAAPGRIEKCEFLGAFCRSEEHTSELQSRF